MRFAGAMFSDFFILVRPFLYEQMYYISRIKENTDDCNSEVRGIYGWFVSVRIVGGLQRIVGYVCPEFTNAIE